MLLLQLVFLFLVSIIIVVVAVFIGKLGGIESSKSAGVGCLVVIGLVAVVISLGVIRSYLTDPMTIDKEDLYGTYVIDKSKFPGYNANWQYERMRFEIIKPNVFKFHHIYNGKIIHTHNGTFTFSPVNYYASPHIILKMNYGDGEDTCHVLKANPTLYREPFSFYYVFESPLFGNIFFTKGEYK